jgi:uncharacterized protein YidB (DUF937 family)
MGLLDQVLGAVLSKSSQSQTGMGGLGDLLGGRTTAASGGGNNLILTLLPLVLMMLQNRGSAAAGNGLGGLLQQLQAAGLGRQADSWVGTGANEAISPEELRGALGPDAVHELAARAGVSDEEASGGLAALLPELVDQLTPEGRLPPDGGQVDTALADLQRSLGI